MKCSNLVLLAIMAAAPAMAGDVSASIGFNQPGFYGQINVGNFPRPAVIYAQPLIVQPPPRRVAVQPVYLRVPPGHYKHWSKHCAEYGACGQPVYFVREDWYQHQYLPHYEHAAHEGPGNSQGRAHPPGHGDRDGD